MRIRPLVALLGLLALCCGPREPQSPPDVVVVLIDTLRSDRLGCYGYPKDTSPFLDELARQGARFADATSQASWTLPSMVSMLQGRYVTAYRDALVPEAPTLAEMFRDAGYATIAVVGNLGMGPPGDFPRGFRWFDNRQARGADGEPLGRARSVEEVLVDLRGHLDAAESLEPGAPRLVYVHLMDPHAPYDAYPELDETVPARPAAPPMPWGWQAAAFEAEEEDWQEIELERGRYDQGVRHTDDGLRAVFDELRGRGILERAVVAVVSDHGECLWEREAPLADAARAASAQLDEFFYRGHGALVHREALATPFLLWGEGVPKGAVIDAPVENVDLLPTLAELCDLPLPAGVHGRSLVPLMNGRPESLEEREAVFAFSHNACTVRELSSGLKLIVPNPWETRGDVEPQLYDLDADPNERVNLVDARPDDVRRLVGRIQDWRRRHPTEDTMGTPLDPEQAARLKALGYTEEDIGR